MATLAVIGSGYVGLPTAAGFARLGHHVTCVDVDAGRIERLRAGRVDMVEDGLPELVREGLQSGRLTFETSFERGVAPAELVFLCVPTPQRLDGDADLDAVEVAVRMVAPSLRDDAVVVMKSTMPVGAAARVRSMLDAAGAPPGVEVVSNPEFLREGHAVEEFLAPHRIVIGARTESVAARVAALYDGLSAPVIITTHVSAELIKYAANAFLAMKISYVNELANLCELVGGDVQDVVRGLGEDPRIGFGWFAPGPGWGGSCLPKDTAALLRTADGVGHDLLMVRAAVEVNERQRARVVERVREACGGDPAGHQVGVWGLAFKANTDDTRASPALAVVHHLLSLGSEIRAYDPAATLPASDQPAGLRQVDSAHDACAGADVLVVLTEWEEFSRVDLAEVASLMAAPRVVDARNVLDPKRAAEAGLEYRSVGR